MAHALTTPSRMLNRQPKWLAILTLLVVILPVIGLIAAIILLWEWGMSWSALGVFLGMYLATGLGITVGYHRLLTHRAFETSRPVKIALAILGSMAVEGPVLRWVAVHRKHHEHSDQTHDPHSPIAGRQGVIGMFKGLWHAHMGWFFKPEPQELTRYVADLERCPAMRVTSALFPLWTLLGLIFPAALCGVITLSWSGVVLGFIWGGLVRILFVHHITWSINSVCHLWGSTPYQTTDGSRNNLIFGFLGLGEGWHNNHHAFPYSAKHGLHWWQFDMSYVVIRLMTVCRLAWNPRHPTADRLEARRNK